MSSFKFVYKTLFVLGFILYVTGLCSSLSLGEYLKIRQNVINEEQASTYGANLILDQDEIAANRTLMTEKLKELDEGYKDLTRFWPARGWLDVRPEIEKTEIFKIIRLMPKGAVLHTHLGASASHDFFYQNLTFMPNLYVCLDNSTVKFQFFQSPDSSCRWQLMKDLRAREPDIISKIKSILTLPRRSTPGYNVDLVWNKFREMSQAFNGIITYRPAYERILQRSLEELYDDNIMYLEGRDGFYRLYELNGTVHDPIVAVEIYKRVLDEFVKSHPGFIGGKFIYSSDRQLTIEQFNAEVEIFRRIRRQYPDFVIGFDIANQEDRGNPQVYYAETLLKLSKETTFYFHAGETNWYGFSVDENLFDAILLNAKRIGHAFALVKHPKLLETVKEKDIAIELNPIASHLGHVDDLRNHPASHYFAKNVSVVVSNDDPGFWESSGLSYDFYEAFMGIMSRKADLRALKQLAINSINYSALTDDEKQKASRIWEDAWTKFVKYLAYVYQSD